MPFTLHNSTCVCMHVYMHVHACACVLVKFLQLFLSLSLSTCLLLSYKPRNPIACSVLQLLHFLLKFFSSNLVSSVFRGLSSQQADQLKKHHHLVLVLLCCLIKAPYGYRSLLLIILLFDCFNGLLCHECTYCGGWGATVMVM